jgi:hypothetical protein
VIFETRGREIAMFEATGEISSRVFGTGRDGLKRCLVATINL